MTDQRTDRPTPRAASRRIALQEREIRRNRFFATVLALMVFISCVIAYQSRPTGDAHPREAAAQSAAVNERPTTSPPGSTTTSGATSPAAAQSSAPTKMPATSTGTFNRVVVPGPTSTAAGRVVTFGVEVENGLGADNAAIATTVRNALMDPRGWQAVDKVRFEQVTPAQVSAGKRPQVDIVIASPKTVDKLCAPLDTGGEWSCGQHGKAVLNYDRWANGVPFIADLNVYHLYMINHEVGHNLGHNHAFCGGQGQPAPVMQQQSMGLHGCTAWPWPARPANSG